MTEMYNWRIRGGYEYFCTIYVTKFIKKATGIW